MTRKRANLTLIREGNPGHRSRADLERGLALESRVPDEPDWKAFWPPVRVPTVRQLEDRWTLHSIEGSLVHIGDDNKRERLAVAKQAHLITTEREKAARVQAENRRARQVARDEWRRVVPILAATGLLTELDAAVLTDHCRVWAELDACVRDIAINGRWQRGERGAQKNPSSTVANQLRTQLKHYLGELGLTPPARDRLQPRDYDEDDDGPFD